MRPFLMSVLSVALLTGATAALAAPATATRPAVEAALAKEGRTLASSDVQAMGKDADLVLIDIVRDTHAALPLRTKAIDALAASGTSVAREHLVRLLATANNTEAELPLVRKALLGLGWLHDARIADNVGPWLSHKLPAIRMDAAVGLALSKNPEAIDLLEKHARGEKDADVREKMEQLVKDYRDAQPKPKPRSATKPRVEPPRPMEGRR